MTEITVKVEAILKLDHKHLKFLDDIPIEELEGIIFEVKEITLPVSFEYLRGVIKFLAPNPLELKKAILHAKIHEETNRN